MNAILEQAMRDGRLEAIFRRWKMWNDDQPRLYARVLAADRIRGRHRRRRAPRRQLSAWDATLRYLPALLRAAVITLVLSCLSMALAVVVGVLIASGRVYGPAPRAGAADRRGSRSFAARRCCCSCSCSTSGWPPSCSCRRFSRRCSASG